MLSICMVVGISVLQREISSELSIQTDTNHIMRQRQHNYLKTNKMFVLRLTYSLFFTCEEVGV